MARKVILSTDRGSDIDDALSLLAMLNHKGICLKGVYTVNGDVNSRSYIAKHIMNLAGKRIAVAKGESSSLDGSVSPYSNFEECFVDDAFIDRTKDSFGKDISYKPLDKVGIITEGVEDMAMRLSKERHSIISIAPLTNIARIIQDHPKASENIERIYIMGCRFSKDTNLEHNIVYDPAAADAVFKSSIPITVIPGDLCARYRMPVEMLDQIKSRPGAYVKAMAKSFLNIIMAQEMKTSRIDDQELVSLFGRDNYSIEFLNSLTQGEKADAFDKKQGLFTNMDDPYYAALYPNEYFPNYMRMIRHLENPKFGYAYGKLIASALREIIPSTISVADVYLPYCFLYPEKTKVRKVEIACDPKGRSYLKEGSKHDLVEDLDFEGFKQFLKTYIK